MLRRSTVGKGEIHIGRPSLIKGVGGGRNDEFSYQRGERQKRQSSTGIG